MMKRSNTAINAAKWSSDAYQYWIDTTQRSILFMDILRKRGNNYIEHLTQGQPAVLVFDHEMVLDGRTFDRPVNYALVRIIDRRSEKKADRPDPSTDRRHAPTAVESLRQRPIVIIDPRAGHGPGIGGSKQDSQIGMALDAGHPVYFMIFFTEPMPSQTLADVRNAKIKFIEEVRRRHPDQPKPAIVANCQGGWAAALIGAERPDIVGPMVFNGSPLSYWGGVQGANPMRYLGGLIGGVWLNSLLSDLGGGLFDGANLVANFENLNPANTYWTKPYNLYAKVDTEENRYLGFEKWWGGFFLMTSEEIHTIVDGLFVGNKLERGEFELEAGKSVCLKNNNNPVLVFASFGDNITPPQQALNWIVKVYGSVDEIKRRGQVVVGILHESIGHLGIFVSAKIARKEHKEIIRSFDMLEYLPPGLYEMRIDEGPEAPGGHEYQVRFIERQMEDILSIDDGVADEEAFYPVRRFSEMNDQFYRLCVSPWVKMRTNAFTAEFFRQLHPQRMQRNIFSDLNPFLLPIKAMAPLVKENRRPAEDDNWFRKSEKQFSEAIVSLLDLYRDTRDAFQEQVFKSIYENPWMRTLFPEPKIEAAAESVQDSQHEKQEWLNRMNEGSYPDAMVRIILALMVADKELRREGYKIAGKLIRTDARMKDISPEELKEMVKIQARILHTDTDSAILSLTKLLSDEKDRQDALEFIDRSMELLDRDINKEEKVVLDKILNVLRT